MMSSPGNRLDPTPIWRITYIFWGELMSIHEGGLQLGRENEGPTQSNFRELLRWNTLDSRRVRTSFI